MLAARLVLKTLPPSYMSEHPSPMLLAFTPPGPSMVQPLGVGMEAIKVALLALMAESTLGKVALPVPMELTAVSKVDCPSQMESFPEIVMVAPGTMFTVVLAQVVEPQPLL